MDSHTEILLAAGAVAGMAGLVPRVKRRVELSRAKHRSLAGHSKMSRLAGRLIPRYEFGADQFFACDGAPPEVATKRRDGFFELAALYRDRFSRSRARTAEATPYISDLQFVQ